MDAAQQVGDERVAAARHFRGAQLAQGEPFEKGAGVVDFVGVTVVTVVKGVDDRFPKSLAPLRPCRFAAPLRGQSSLHEAILHAITKTLT